MAALTPIQWLGAIAFVLLALGGLLLVIKKYNGCH